LGSPVQGHPELVSGSGFDALGGGDGGPLTDNVVFTAISEFSAFKPTAILMLATWNSQLATALRRTGPRSWTVNEKRFFTAFSGIFPAKRPLRTPMLSGALLLMFYSSSRQRESLPDEVGLTSPDVLPGITSWDVFPSMTS